MKNKRRMIKRLKLLQKKNDFEDAHVKADEILLQIINNEDIRKEYEKIKKYYA